MPTIEEGNLKFDFPENWFASKFDEWSFYLNQFQSVCGGAKGVDVVAVDPDACLWQIEAKDYRRHRRTKTIADERQFARRAVRCPRIRIVLHLEQPTTHSKLFPRAIDPAKVKQRLKQLIKAIDPHPLVLEMSRMQGVAWSVS